MEGRLSSRALRTLLVPPRPYELLALLSEGALLLLIRFRAGLEFPAVQTLLQWIPFLLFLFWHILGGAALRTALAAARGGWRRSLRYGRRWLEPRRLTDLLRIILFTALMAHAYTWLKIFVPILNTHLFDDWFYAADNFLFLGVNPNRLVLGLFPSPAMRRFFDWQYTFYLESVLVGVAWFASTLCLVERQRFLAAFTALWLASAWIYVAFPTLGPCYTFPEDYVEAHVSMPLQASTQQALIRQYGAVRATPKRGSTPYLNPVFGVAAMPSLHVGAQVFLAVWARRRNPLLCLGYTVLAILTFLGSLITGWHYAVDGYAGALLGVAAAWFGDGLSQAPLWRWRRSGSLTSPA